MNQLVSASGETTPLITASDCCQIRSSPARHNLRRKSLGETHPPLWHSSENPTLSAFSKNANTWFLSYYCIKSADVAKSEKKWKEIVLSKPTCINVWNVFKEIALLSRPILGSILSCLCHSLDCGKKISCLYVLSHVNVFTVSFHNAVL